jgi:glutamine amidotransferase
VCRHFAWLGASRTIEDLVYGPSYGLPRQATRPRWQREGLFNLDGHGAGWYAGNRSDPCRYRSALPIPMDAASFPPAKEASTCVLGAVRSATPGLPIEEAATAPFTRGRYLLSLNGHFQMDRVRDLHDPSYVPDSDMDSALLACLLWQRLDADPDLERAVIGVVNDVLARDPGSCLNLLVVDGQRIVGTTWQETLCYRVSPDGVMVASERHDDADDWKILKQDVLISVDAKEVVCRPLTMATPAGTVPFVATTAEPVLF